MDIENLVLTYSQMKHLRELGLDTSDAALVLIYEDAEGNECEPGLVDYNAETNSYFFDNGEIIKLRSRIHYAEDWDYDYSYKADGQVYTLQELLNKFPKKIEYGIKGATISELTYGTLDLEADYQTENAIQYWHIEPSPDGSLLPSAYKTLVWYLKNVQSGFFVDSRIKRKAG